MNFLVQAFNTILYQPLFNALVLIYNFIPGKDFGIAVILLTVLIRLILHPMMNKSLRSQRAFAQLQPKLKEIQTKFKNDQQKQAEELLKLYQSNKINPFSGFLPLLVQLPLLIALYQVFWKGLEPGAMSSLYSFIPNTGAINPTFLGLINLSQASMILAIIAGTVQFFQAKTMNPNMKTGNDQAGQFASMMQKQMMYVLPIFTIMILLKLPAAIALYWIVTSLFSIGQQYAVNKEYAGPE